MVLFLCRRKNRREGQDNFILISLILFCLPTHALILEFLNKESLALESCLYIETDDKITLCYFNYACYYFAY